MEDGIENKKKISANAWTQELRRGNEDRVFKKCFERDIRLGKGYRGNTSWSNAIIVPMKALVKTVNITGLILLTIILLGLMLTYWICRSSIHRAVKPLQLLAKSADEVAKGNFKNPR